MKRPAFQFYPADWRKDAALQSCSIAARSLWIEMICVMHECTPYGHLMINGHALNLAQLARLVGEAQHTVKRLLAELENAGVFSRAKTGCIYSRRMVNDEHLRGVRAESGRLGGHPNLLKQKPTKVTEDDQANAKQTGKQKPTPSSSSSTSVYSVPNGTDAGASPHSVGEMTKDELWTTGKSLLSQAGMPKAQCGSFVGKLCKDYGERVALEAVRTAVVKRPADPSAFLKAVCQRLAGERCHGPPKHRQNFDTINYREGIAADGSF